MYQEMLARLLNQAGIRIGGDQSWDIIVHDDRFYQKVLSEGNLGLGESYMDGWWDCRQLDEFFYRVIKADLESKIRKDIRSVGRVIIARLMNLQSKKFSLENVIRHYDVGNDLFENMLDSMMNYSCGYWKNAKDLDGAQEAKMDLICKKIGLRPGMKILDIGCGWGGFAKYAAQKYGAEVLGITLSEEQRKYAIEFCKGFPIKIVCQDYRDIEGEFDAIVSIGMFEHVGPKNYQDYMKIVHSSLKEDGVFLLHTIGSNISKSHMDPWIDKYVFPGGMLPSVRWIGESIENLFVIEDIHNFGEDYDRTLMAWYDNFHKSWPILKGKYDERFQRMWDFYLLSCAGSFRARSIQLWQIVLTKTGRKQPNCRIS